MVGLATPTVSSFAPTRRVTPKSSTANLISSIPGVGSIDTRGGIPATTQRVQPREESTPLQRYQETIRKRIQEGQQHTDDIRRRTQTRTGFQKKYALNAQKQGWNQEGMPQTRGYVGAKGGKKGWGGYRNGQIPAQAMRGIGGGHYMRADAATAFQRMNAAYRQAFGRNIAITDSYRPYGAQVRLRRTKPGLAAPPGTSNHGWGLAVDLGGGINRHGTRENNWMKQYARQFGFRPLSGAKGRLEPWHWEFG